MKYATALEIPQDCLEAIRWEAARVSRRLPWRVDRDDLEQEGALAVWREMAGREAISQAKARVVSRNAMYSEARRLMRWDRLAPDGEGEDQAEQRPDPEAVLDVRDALERLGETHRQILLLSLGDPPSKLAGGLGLTVSGAAHRLASARKKLRGELGEAYEHMSRKVAVKYSKWARFGCYENQKAKRKAKGR